MDQMGSYHLAKEMGRTGNEKRNKFFQRPCCEIMLASRDNQKFMDKGGHLEIYHPVLYCRLD